MKEALDVVRAAAAFGLPTEHRSTDGADPPALIPEVIALAIQHRVQGLLWTAIEAGALTGSEELVGEARDALAAALRTCLVCEETAALALTALDRAGVEARVLKGIAIAHLDHADPAQRIFGDADLLIRRTDYRRALESLVSAGFRRAEPPVRGWWERRFGKSIVMLTPGGAELDLHLAITGGYFGEKIDHEALWSSTSEPFDLAGVPARALDREGRLLQACCHSVLGGNSGLRAQRDIAQLVLVAGADWQAVVSRARHDGIDLVVAEAVRATWGGLQLDPEHGVSCWAIGCMPAEVQSRALAGYRAAFERGWASEGRSVLPALGLGDRLLFIVGLAVPTRASLAFRQRSWRQHATQALASSRG